MSNSRSSSPIQPDSFLYSSQDHAHYTEILSMENTPANSPESSPRPTSSPYDLTDHRAAQVREGLCRRIISKQKISQKDHHLFITLLSSQVPSEEILKEQEGNLIHLRELDQVFTTIKMFIDKAWKMTQEYELVLWNEETNLRGQDYSIALSLSEDIVIQYSTSAMVQGRNFLGTLEPESLTTEEYQALREAILEQSFKSLDNEIRLKLTRVLYYKLNPHLYALDRADYFSDSSSDFLSSFKQAIQAFFTNGSDFNSENSGLKEDIVSSFSQLYQTIAKFHPEYQQKIFDELVKHNNALQNYERLEDVQTYLLNEAKNIDELTLAQAEEIEIEMPEHECQVRERSQTLNSLIQSTPFKEPSNSSSESLIVFTETNNNFNTPAKEASRKTMQHIRDNTANQEKLFNANPDEKTNEKQRLLDTLLAEEILSPDQIHTSAWLIANGARPKKEVLKKSKWQLYTLLRIEERMLREEEARSEWIQQVNTALLEVTQYVNEEINKLDKKNPSKTNSDIESEKNNLNAKLKAIHQAAQDINEGKSVRKTLDALRKNENISKKRSIFSSNTLKKVENITLKLTPSAPVRFEEKGIKGLAKACLTVREDKLKKINEREEKTKLAITLLESVKTHIQIKLKSIFTIDKETLKSRLAAIETAITDLGKIKNDTIESHDRTISNQDEGSVCTVSLSGTGQQLELTPQQRLNQLENESCMAKQRLWSLFPKETKIQKSIAAITALSCAAAA